MMIISGIARSFLMAGGPDEAMDLKSVGGSGGMQPQENFGICGYGDAFWCNLMAKLYSAEINLNQRKISIRKIKKNRDKYKVVRPRFCLKLIYIWNKILLLIIKKMA